MVFENGIDQKILIPDGSSREERGEEKLKLSNEYQAAENIRKRLQLLWMTHNFSSNDLKIHKKGMGIFCIARRHGKGLLSVCMDAYIPVPLRAGMELPSSPLHCQCV